jgi:hypothetical protein
MKAYGYVEAMIFTLIFFLSRGCSQHFMPPVKKDKPA